jgi:hypothetical protein
VPLRRCPLSSVAPYPSAALPALHFSLGLLLSEPLLCLVLISAATPAAPPACVSLARPYTHVRTHACCLPLHTAAMAYYNDPTWPAPAPGRQPSWEQPQPPSRSGAGSTVNRDEANAFVSQFDEVDRAAENLAKGGKPFGGYPPTPMTPGSRRESMPMPSPGPRPYPDYGTVVLPTRHKSSH